MQSLREQEGVAQREQEALRVEFKEYKKHEGVRWTLKKEELLQSPEFCDLVGAREAPFLEKGFEGAVSQFKKVGYPLEGASLDFLNLQKLLDNILDE